MDEVAPFSLAIGFESLFGKLPPQARAHLKPLVPLTCKPKSELVTKNHGLISHKPKLNLEKERDVEFHFSNKIQVKLILSLFNTQSHSTFNSCKSNLSHKQF